MGKNVVMKFASFEVNGRQTYGTLAGDSIVEAGENLRAQFADLRSVIGAEALSTVAQDASGQRYALQDITFLPLIPKPDKIICVGVNYRPHIEEMGRQIPDYPVLFVRFPGSLVGHGQNILRPQVSEQYDYEGELAIVIGKRARHVSRQDALNYIAGYCCFMDGSVRDWQKHTMQFTAGKNFANSGAIGPWLVSRDEVPVPSALKLTTRVNRQVMQEGSLDELLFDIPHLIEYCSTFTELLPGDVIATGTPGGVGAARTPPQWLKPGDLVEVDIDGVGRLENTVKDE